jgi:hypothetical protein
VLYFSPVASGSTPGGSKSVQPAVVGGVGLDWRATQHVALRLGYRGVFYRPPSFGIATQTLDTFTEMNEPYVGLVLRF